MAWILVRRLLRDLILKFASRLRFPVLFFLTAGLFVLDLILPDIVPFADELLLGLLTLLLGSWQKKRKQPASPNQSSSTPRTPVDDTHGEIIDITVEEEH